MSFEVSADAYLSFMGRYSEPLAVLFADEPDIRPAQRTLDVACAPGPINDDTSVPWRMLNDDV